MTADALAFLGVSKRYTRRAPPALDELSCRFPRGSLCGLVGPNGAGKTTAFSVVCGFLEADAGEVHIFGERGFDPWSLRGRLGVLPQDAELGDRHTPKELLVHLARLQGLSARDAPAAADRALDTVDLTSRRNRRIGTLSHGMRRRVAVASALVGDPALVMLDEPTAGLDPMQSHQLREALRKRPRGQTLIVSSHNLDELERICDWVVMMDRGRCVRQGTVEEVTGQGLRAEWWLGPGVVPLDALRAGLPGYIVSLEGDCLTLEAPPGAELDAAALLVADALVKAKVPIREVRRGMSLEKRFLDDARATVGF